MSKTSPASQSSTVTTSANSTLVDKTKLSFINRHPFIAAQLITLGFVAVFLAITAIILGIFAFTRVRVFTLAAGTTPQALYQTFRSGWSKTPVVTNNHKNILLLGVDSLETRGTVPPLTDTMMLLSLNIQNGEVKTIPLPRDIWNDDFQTKINALYAYGHERYPHRPEQFPEEVVASMSGIPIHHTIVLSMEQVADVIDQLGGIEIDVETGFIDSEFPRSDVDITVERDPTKLYETVEFKAGPQTMNGQTALKYIRSRHSVGTEGDDVARSKRQQQVIRALMAKAIDPSLVKQPEKLGQLFKLYQDDFSQAISLEELIATAKALWPHRQNIAITGNSIGIAPTHPEGTLTNPPLSAAYQRQWVYIVTDQAKFSQEVQTKLGIVK